MAARTFLTPEQLSEARNILRPPMSPPHGQVLLDHSLTSALDFSSWLSLMIENRLREVEGWEEAAPIAIGSWGRGELCPGSDLDVLFCGKPSAVRKVVEFAEGAGWKFRYRVPENMKDWTQNVEVLEVNALFNAKAFTQVAAERLQEQKDIILKKSGSFRRDLMKAIISERKLRFKRYDSIANFLQPNLKFGSGGLRDLQQALMLREWYGERFADDEYSFKVLNYYKCFFLMIRQRLHLNNTLDVLTAQDQLDLAQWFGFQSHRNFMMEVQKGLSRVSFHSDWANERCSLTKKQLSHFSSLEPQSWQDCIKLLEEDASSQTLASIRKKLFDSEGFRSEKISKKHKGKILKKVLDIKQDEAVTIGAFRSQMVSHLIPNFTDVIGLVQHDQYHRYTVDAHLLQAVREVQRIYSHPKLLGPLEYYAEKLNQNDWNILRWAALYHDMAKGKQGDHSQEGKELALKDLRSFGLSKDFVLEVAWLVENHLVLSVAAFRKNPQSPQTWEYLFSRGVRGKRLYRLLIFTVIDINATNPEAWNSWKENLLREMVETLRNPDQERHYEFGQKVRRRQLDVPQVFINNLEVHLVEAISDRQLIQDFKEILNGKELPPLVIKDKRNRVWMRFHRKNDKAGLVLSFTQKLTSMGCNIREAFIYTDPVMGVYDWFCVKTNKSLNVLKKQIALNLGKQTDFQTKFSEIELVSFDGQEWVFSFRAKDKKGLLLSAIETLHQEELDISWAKVHTWGRQIDDVFGVKPKKGSSPQQQLERLKELLEEKEMELLS